MASLLAWLYISIYLSIYLSQSKRKALVAVWAQRRAMNSPSDLSEASDLLSLLPPTQRRRRRRRPHLLTLAGVCQVTVRVSMVISNGEQKGERGHNGPFKVN